MRKSKIQAQHNNERKENNFNELKKTTMKQLSEFLNSKDPDLSSVKKEIVNLKMIEEDQINEAFKDEVVYGDGLLQTFDYPESRYYCFTYGYSKKD